MSIRTAICDDESQQAEYVKRLVSKWAEQNNITVNISTFSSAEAFLFEWGEDKDFDIILLDIQMRDINGVELAREIRKSDSETAIIFITGFPDFISEGYDVAALHYLMKPVRENKLFEVLDRAYSNIIKTSDDSVIIPVNRANVRIPLSDITYVEASAHYVIINTVNKHEQFEQMRTKMSLGEIEKILGDGFFRCTRSFIVGLRYVIKISKSEVTLTDGTLIPLGRGLYDSLNKAIIQYF